MATHVTSFGELMAMPFDDLRKEIVTQRALVRKMRLSIHLNKEKDTAKYRREKRALARMLTACVIVLKLRLFSWQNLLSFLPRVMKAW